MTRTEMTVFVTKICDSLRDKIVADIVKAPQPHHGPRLEDAIDYDALRVLIAERAVREAATLTRSWAADAVTRKASTILVRFGL